MFLRINRGNTKIERRSGERVGERLLAGKIIRTSNFWPEAVLRISLKCS